MPFVHEGIILSLSFVKMDQRFGGGLENNLWPIYKVAFLRTILDLPDKVTHRSCLLSRITLSKHPPQWDFFFFLKIDQVICSNNSKEEIMLVSFPPYKASVCH